jgi:2'-5' RNA ligase
VRAFIGIPIPDILARAIYDSFERKRSAVPDIRWVVPGNYHITVIFLGEISQSEAERIGRILDGIAFGGGAEAALGNLGVFPKKGSLRVLHVELAAGEEYCMGVHAKVSGLLPEYAGRRRYMPHITLGRAKQGRRVTWGGHRISLPGGTFRLEEIVLYQSHLTGEGAVYAPIHSTRL